MGTDDRGYYKSVANGIQMLLDENKFLRKYSYIPFKKEPIGSYGDLITIEETQYVPEKDYIPKSKVREKIEEINKEQLNYNEDYYWFEQEIQGYAIDKLQELLQEGDK